MRALRGRLGTMGLTDTARYEIDFRLARNAVLSEFRKGRLGSNDLCDAHPDLLRAARNVGESTGETCPICGRRTRKTPDVLDELVEAVIDTGAAIHHVRAETELSDKLTASSLRFVLPPMPEPAQAGTA